MKAKLINEGAQTTFALMHGRTPASNDAEEAICQTEYRWQAWPRRQGTARVAEFIQSPGPGG